MLLSADMIPDKPLWRKELLQIFALPLIVILVGIGCYELGRLSVLQEEKSPVVLHGVVVGGKEQPVSPVSAPQ